MAFHYLGLGKRNVMNHFPGQTMDLFSEKIGIHGFASFFCKGKDLLLKNYLPISLFYLKKDSDLCRRKNEHYYIK